MLHNLGAPLHVRFKERINAELPGRFYELYGLTEGFVTKPGLGSRKRWELRAQDDPG